MSRLNEMLKIFLFVCLFILMILPVGPIKAVDSEDSESDSTAVPEYYLKEIVVTASRYEKSPFATSQAVSVASRWKIQRENNQIISDLFRTMPGIEVNDAGPFRTRPVIRGFFGSRILILVDGERLNDTRESTFSGAQLSLVDLGGVDRVEVVRGPGSVLYGTDAVGGVINIISKQPRLSEDGNLNMNGSLQLRYSTADAQRRGRMEFGLAHRKFSFLLGSGIREAKDYKSPEETVVNSGLGQEQSFDFKGKYLISENRDIFLDYQKLEAEDIGYPGAPNDLTPKFFFPYHNRDKIVLRYEAKNISNILPQLKAKVYYQELEKEFDSEVSVFMGPGRSFSSLSKTFTDVKLYGISFQELFLISKDQHLSWGIDYFREKVDGNRWVERVTVSDFIDTTETIDTSSTVPENTLDALGIFMENEFNFLKRTSLTLGIRYDRFWVKTKKTSDYLNYSSFPPQPFESSEQSLSSVNGSLGIVYKLSKYLNLTGNAGSAYRAPNVVEKYFFGQASGEEFVIPNYDLEPEKSTTFDVGLRVNLEKYYGSLTFFYNSVHDFIELESTGDSIRIGHASLPEWHYTNITEAEIKGIEGEFQGDLPRNFFGFCNFTYNEGDNITLDQPIFIAPFKATIGLGWKDRTEKLWFEMSLRYVAEQNRVPKDSQGKYLDRLPTPSFTVVNLKTSISLFSWQTLNIALDNLIDKTYSEPYNASNSYNPVVEPGRNLIVSLTTRF
ncbi:MAG: TonB-dependent receptor [Candidatus Zixiibacteriota bacterium]